MWLISRQVGMTIGTCVAATIVSLATLQRNILLLGAIALLALAVTYPVQASLGMFGALVPFEGVSKLGDTGITLTRIIGGFAGLVLLSYGFLTGRLGRPSRAALWWGLLVLWSALSLLWATDRAASVERVGTVATLFALYLIAVSYRFSAKELEGVLALTIIGGVLASAVVIYQYRSGSLDRADLINRGSIVVGDRQSNANEQAASLLLPLSLALAGAVSPGTPLKRKWMLGVFALLTTAVLLTMSRGGLIALSALLLVFLLRSKIRTRLLVPILLITATVPFMPNQFFERLHEASFDRGTGRYDIWIAGLQLVERHPISGVGLGDFPTAYDEVAGYAPVFRGYHFSAHNMYLDVCAETGLIGLALFCAAIYTELRQLRRSISRSQTTDYLGIALEAACWGMLVQGLSGHIEWSKFIWLIWILVTVHSSRADRQQEVVSFATRYRPQIPRLADQP